MKPIPDDVKEILNGLSGPQQVAVRGYIAELRSTIKDLEGELLVKNDPDPHAHYHDHVKCTEDHSHESHDHKDHGHNEKNHDEHSHDHKEHKHDEGCGHDHNHKEEHGHDHDHKEEHKPHDHDHKEHKHDHNEEHKHHDHKGHEHKHHDHAEPMDHEHTHDQKRMSAEQKDDEIPPWKKKALESGSDPSVAPFGGSWNTESNVSASEKMQE